MPTPIALEGTDGASMLLLYGLSGANAPDVIEGATYKFRFDGDWAPTGFQPEELFEVDPDDPATGRFRPQNHVGTVTVAVAGTERDDVCFNVDVHPAKLSYDDEYRSLLEQVADHAAEAVLQGFAPSMREVHASADEVGELEYRSLAFVAARLRDAAFQSAIARILASPHRRWHSVPELRSISRGVPAGPAAARSLQRPGARSAAPAHVPLPALPRRVEHPRNEISYDTNPNRFVAFVFRHWQSLAMNIEQRLQSIPIGVGPQRRGLAEARWIVDECDRVLRTGPLRDVSAMRSFPQGDPVLLRQPGYREVLRVFALAEASMALNAELDDDIFSATQRNIATLYEYWCFLVLVNCLTEICGEPTAGTLFRASRNGLSLVLSEGSRSLMSWFHEQDGRRLSIDLWFNQTFSRSDVDNAEISSWASSIRPDASLRIRPISGRPAETPDPLLDTWLHFDAKFRLDVRGSEVNDDDPKSTAKRGDLLKMHAYRDLIRRTAGAYVLYPGFGTPQHRTEYHEVLPGIGAFPLRPGLEDQVTGRSDLLDFLSETLGLAANQASSNERAQFWRHEHTREAGRTVSAVNFLSVPPADELVLIGYARPDQLRWVLQKNRYNLRGDGRRGAVSTTDRMLGARLLLIWTRDAQGDPQLVHLFERTGPWQIAAAQELHDDGYPLRARARTYLVSPINAVTSAVDAMVTSVDRIPLSGDGQPTLSSWDVVGRR